MARLSVPIGPRSVSRRLTPRRPMVWRLALGLDFSPLHLFLFLSFFLVSASKRLENPPPLPLK